MISTQTITWHSQRVDISGKHILCEMTDHTMISGYMKDIDGVMFFIADNPVGQTENARLLRDDIARWCDYPGEENNDAEK